MSRIATLTLNPTIDISTRTDRVEPTSKMRCSVPRRDPGGGGINAARVIGLLGGDAIAVYPAGGPCGSMLTTALESLGVTQYPVPVAGETRESFTVDEADSGLQYRFVLPGPTLSSDELHACIAAIEGLQPSPAYLIVSGSYPPGVALSFHDQIIALAERIGARLVLDCSGAPLGYAIERGGLYLVKPSIHELSGVIGRRPESEAELHEVLAGLIEQGAAQIILLTLGQHGALLASAEGIERFEAFEVGEVSAVGAGDSTLGATVLALSRGLALHDAVRYGMAAGAATAMSPGTALCSFEDVQRLFEQSPA